MDRPSLRFRVEHKQMEQFTQHPSLTTSFEIKSKTDELKAQCHLESSHGITSTSIMPSYKVIRQSEIPLRITIIANGLLHSARPHPAPAIPATSSASWAEAHLG